MTELVAPDAPDAPLETIVIEAVYSGVARPIAWRDLHDETQWRQGWV